MVDTGSTIQGVQKFLKNGMGLVEVPAVIAAPTDDVPVVITSGLVFDKTNTLYYMGYTGSTWVKLGSVA